MKVKLPQPVDSEDKQKLWLSLFKAKTEEDQRTDCAGCAVASTDQQMIRQMCNRDKQMDK